MKHKPLRKTVGSVYADFGFTMYEVFACALCGVEEWNAIAKDNCSLIGVPVPTSAHCPVAGMVGVCKPCLGHVGPDTFSGGHCFTRLVYDPLTEKHEFDYKNIWLPPPMVQPIKRTPIYVLLRGFADDARLSECVRKTWTQIPDDTRRAMIKHWRKPRHEDSGFCKGALRVEALPNWPERTHYYLGQCLQQGHAIRLHSPTVSAMPDDVLMTLIAHEMAHCYQSAAWFDRHPQKSVEEDAIEIMSAWGFRNSAIDEWEMARIEEQMKARWEKLRLRADKMFLGQNKAKAKQA